MDRIPCRTCHGQGSTKVCMNPEAPDEQKEYVTQLCPSCGGSKYEGIYGIERNPDDIVAERKKAMVEKAENISDEQKAKIYEQLVKYPKLFTEGVGFPYADENPEIFIYLKNKYMFNIEPGDAGMKVSLKQEFKNKLAESVIVFLKAKLN